MTDHTLYDTTVPSQGSAGLAHQKILRLKVGGVFVNITGDINNLALNPTKITVPRERYGQKARPANEIIGYSFAPTFTVETTRDPVTKAIVAAQSWLVDLMSAAFKEGSDNLREFQIITDALDERFPAFEGTFSVSVTDGNTAYADKAVLSFTLESQGVVETLAVNPVAGDGTPIIEAVGPAGQTVGEQVVIRGYGFTGTTAITIDGEPVGTATEGFSIVDDNTIVATIPASVTGEAPVIVTNAAGASDAFAYTAATV